MDMHEIFVLTTSVPMMYIYTGLLLYGIHYICQKRQIDDERWYGTVHSAIQTVHAMGIQFGPAWLEAIEEAFEEHYKDQHGKAPSLLDIKAGVADAARLVAPQVLPLVGQLASSLLRKKLNPDTNTTLGGLSSLQIENSTVPTQPVSSGAQSSPLAVPPAP